jgi:hypothetical protein
MYFIGWANEYKGKPGMERVTQLSKDLPKRKQAVTQAKSKVLKETEADPFQDEEDEEAQSPNAAGPSRTPQASPPIEAGPSNPKAHKPSRSTSNFSTSVFGPASSSVTSSPKDKKSKSAKSKSKSKRKPFNLQAELPTLKSTLAESSIASTNLLNALQRVNRATERVSENAECVQHFEACKRLRRAVLRYIHYVETEQWLGALITANDALVTSLMTFEQLDRSIDADSDSDDELAEQAHAYRMLQEQQLKRDVAVSDGVAKDLAGLRLETEERPPVAPPRPGQAPEAAAAPGGLTQEELEALSDYVSSDEEVEDENNPFGDTNAVHTPSERKEPTW